MASQTEGRTEGEKAVIQRQLAWMAASMALAGLAVFLGLQLWTWGRESGWGNPARAVANNMQRGEQEQVAGRLAAAARAYRIVAERYQGDPQAPQAMIQLANLQQQLGQSRESLETLEKLDARLKGDAARRDLWAYSLLQLGGLRRQLGDYRGAQEALSLVRARFPRSDWAGEAQQGLGKLLQAQGRYPEARAAFAVLVKEIPGGFLAAEAEASIAECYQLEKNPRAALQVYQRMARRYPEPVLDGVKERAEALQREIENAPAKGSPKR